jgi:methyl-accepting chemotaxis protein
MLYVLCEDSILNLKKMGISAKVNLLVCSIVLFGFIVMSAIILTNIYSKSLSNAEDLAKKEAMLGAASIEGDLNKTKYELNRIKDTIVFAKDTKSLSRIEVISLFKKYVQNNPEILAFYTLWEPNKFDGKDNDYVNTAGHDQTGRLIPYLVKTSKGVSLDALIDYEKEGAGDYYLLPKKTGLISLIDPYIYPIDGKDVLIASLTMPIFDKNNSFIGMVGADFKVDYIQGLIEKIKPMGGYTALSAMDGKLVAHGLDKKWIGQNLQKAGVSDEVVNMLKEGKGHKEYAFSKAYNSDTLRIYTPIHIKGTNSYWSFITVIPKSAILADFYFYLNLILAILVILITIIVFTNIQFINKLLNPLKIVNNAMINISNGDLKTEINESDLSNDEIGSLGRTLNSMAKNLRGLIGQVNKSIEDISASSQEMSASTDQTAQGAQQTAKSTAQMAEGAQNISSNVEQGAISVNTMNKVIQGISEEAKLVAKLGNDTELNANEGNKYVKNAVEKIDSIKTVAEDISVTVSELGTLSSQIETIVDLIKTIAGQTNLLALNAAIEAARAGEHGKGFAVVAEEVKKLATESAGATDKITNMIKEIQNKTGVAVNKMDRATHEVEEGVTVVNEAGKTLENIISQVKTANTKIQEITGQIDNVAFNSQEVVSMIENISAVTEETAASAEEISSITEEQTASLQEISASSQTLAKIAEHLNKQVSIFKV